MGILKKTIQSIMKRSMPAGRIQTQASEEKEALYAGLEMNFSKVKAAFGNSKDVVTEEIRFDDPSGGFLIGYIYTQGLVSSTVVQDFLQQSFVTMNEHLKQDTSSDLNMKLSVIRNFIASTGKLKTVNDFHT